MEKAQFQTLLNFFKVLANESRRKGRSSKRCQKRLSDSSNSIRLLRKRSRLNCLTRRPSAAASDTIHVNGGRLRSNPILIAFPPPLYNLVNIHLSAVYPNLSTYMSECVPANQTSDVCGRWLFPRGLATTPPRFKVAGPKPSS